MCLCSRRTLCVDADIWVSTCHKLFFPQPFENVKIRDFCGSPVVKTLRTPNSGCVSSVPGWESSTCCVVWQKKKKKVKFVHFFAVENRREARLGMWTQVCWPLPYFILVSLPPAPSSAVCQTLSVSLPVCGSSLLFPASDLAFLSLPGWSQ